MKTMKKLLLVLLFSMLIVLAIGMVSAAYADEAGTYNGLSWKYTESDKTLEFSGSGSIPELEESETYPWDKYKASAEYITFNPGVTEIGNHTFGGYKSLKLIKIPYDTSLQYDPGYYDEESPSDPFSGSNTDNLKIEITGKEDVMSTEPAKRCAEWGYYIVGYGWSVESLIVPYKYDWLDEQEHADNGAIIAEKIYTGKKVKPAPVIFTKDGDKLTEGIDYTLSYTNNVNVGTAWCILKGAGDYFGETKLRFVIYPKSTSITKIVPAKKAFTVQWLKQTKKMKTKHITGYLVQYSASKNFSSSVKNKTVKGYKKASLKIKGLKAKKTYYVRVRTYYKDSKDQYRATWSKKMKVKTR